MDQGIIRYFSEITEEEKQFLSGDRKIDRTLYMDGSRDVISGSKLLEKGKQIAIRPHTRFVHFPEHTHDYVEFVYMYHGTTTHVIDGTRVFLKEGDLLFMNQHAVQEILPAGKDDIAVNFMILPQFFDSAAVSCSCCYASSLAKRTALYSSISLESPNTMWPLPISTS